MPSAIRSVPHGEGLPVLQLNWENVIPKFYDDDLHTETVDLMVNNVDPTYLLLRVTSVSFSKMN